MVNHFSGNLGIPKLAAATTFRTAGRSFMIFNDFAGTKFRLENREQIAQLLANLRAGTITQTK
jgi:hypothetical protein